MKASRRGGIGWSLAACVAAILGVSAVQAGTVYVSQTGNDGNDGLSWGTAKLTVQGGLNASAAGDQVWVAAGTYPERITLKDGVGLYGGFAGTETELLQRDWRANRTVLDSNAGSVVTALAGVTASARIDGFVIRNGGGTRWGSGLRPASYGGGIYCHEASPTIANNVIRGNRAMYGGGISCNLASPIIVNNIITGNMAVAENDTGSIGGAIYCTNSAPLVANNTIAGNIASSGGGILYTSSSPTIVNTILAFNASGIHYAGGGTATIRHNCVYGNRDGNYYGTGNLTGKAGNISLDPNLAGLGYWKAHIQPDSPCRDAGDDSFVQAGWQDLDGQARILGAHVDIGADESDGTVWPIEPVLVVRVSPAGNDANDGSSWTLAKRTLQTAMTEVAPGEQVWVAAGTYLGAVSLKAEVAIYGGFANSETELSQRNWVTNRTIFDGQGATVVTMPAGASPATRIDGFTIRNGGGSGAIFCSTASPTLANNTLTGNKAPAIYCEKNASPTIANSTIAANSATNGAGVYCSSASPAIINCTITGNTAAEGAGIYCASSSPTIVNTIIAANSSGIYRLGGTPTLRHTCVYGNSAYNYSGLADPAGTDGNIAADPRLAAVVTVNIHIQPDSPCVDAGDDALIDAAWRDMDFQPRIQGEHVDIGADESDGTVWPPAPAAIVRVSPAGDDANDGSTWPLAKRTVQAGIDAAAATGGEVWVAEGTYAERTILANYVHLYGGFAGDETSRSERDRVIHVTILDASYGGSVVTIQPGYRASTLDGFTIRNGSNWSGGGGGISCASGSPTIANNTITGNQGSTSYAAGIYCGPTASPIIVNNTITANRGICLMCGGPGASPIIVNNTITANRGDGLICGGSPTIANNTIAGNRGIGLSCSSPSATIANNIVAINFTGVAASATTPFRNNCVYDNGTNYSGLADPTGTNGNISVDPRMAGASWRDVHIQPDSPCIDVGDDSVVLPDASDMDGAPRVLASRVDIGADESDGSTWPTAPVAIIRVSPAGDDANDGSTWALARRSVDYGLDAALWGDQVWVAAGTYTGNVYLGRGVQLYGGFAGTETELSQRDWRVNPTILDGERKTYTVVRAPEGATPLTRIDGFVIRNGVGATTTDYIRLAAGIYCKAASPTIANNTITGNTTLGDPGHPNYGAGIYCESSAATIIGNTITGNSSSSGGGIYCTSFSGAILNNTITDNAGGAIYCTLSSPLIANNTIANNNAVSGGAIYSYKSSLVITNNLFAGNSASEGGAINCWWNSTMTLVNNTLVANDAGSGGAVLCANSTLTIANTIIALNSSGIKMNEPCTLSLRHNCVYGNTGGDYLDVNDPTGTDGNISVDPQLPGSGRRNAHIQPGSPCIDAGDDTLVPPDWLDIDGQPRIAAAHVDIGADESDGTTWPPEVNFILRVSPAGNDANDGSSWPLAKRTVNAAATAAVWGDQVWVAAGTYVENIALRPGVELYGGFDGSETDLSHRDWHANVTILDGNQAGNVVAVAPAAATSNRIDGFVIRNGRGLLSGSPSYYLGGGISCGDYSSPTIANNTITANTDNAISCRSHCSPAITNNIITANKGHAIIFSNYGSPAIAGNVITVNGGTAIHCPSNTPTVTGNTIADNSGLGIYCGNGPSTISHNTITRNAGRGIACSGGATISNNTIAANAGGGISSTGPVTILNNTILANTVSGNGGGISATSLSTIANNTIVGNTASPSSGSPGGGGGIYCSYATISNNTIVGNAAPAGGGIYSAGGSPTIVNTIVAFNSSGLGDSGSGQPLVRHCCVYGNRDYNYDGFPDPTGTNGNLSVDPHLANRLHGNAHIQPGSPCVDAGDPSAVQADWLDMDGQPRTAGAGVDIGADESDGTLWPEGSLTVVRVASNGDNANDGSTWAQAKQTLQAGIDAAAAGGEVWVAAGTYVERITLPNHVHLYGGFASGEAQRSDRDWSTNRTILDGSQGGSVVTAKGVGYCLATVDGFVIRNGKASANPNYGGGIYCSLASPTIANCTITGNSAYYGGGISCQASFATIVNCAITGNAATSDGGGIYCSSGAPAILNNTIAGNTSSYGGGISCPGSRPVIVGTIVAFNSSGIYGPAALSLRHNCVYGNDSYNYGASLPDPTGTNGNISADPKLASLPYGNVHIQPGSPCIDAGDDAAVQADSLDMDAGTRIVGTHVDIGADESDGAAPPAGPYSIVRVRPDGDDAGDGSSWALAKRTVQAGIDAGAAVGGEVWVAAGTYNERISLRNFTHVYGGFAGTEGQRFERDPSIQATILDGGQAGSVVTAAGLGYELSTIDGFVIRNGIGTQQPGGGIYCYNASPRISGNTITGNTASLGGGIYCSGSPAIVHNTITGNGAAEGGGIYSGAARIIGNTITGNIASRGGGVHWTSSVLANNVIAGNIAVTVQSINGRGGGIYCLGSGQCVGNTITANRADEDGGGFYLNWSASPLIGNTIVAFNSSGIFKQSDSNHVPQVRSDCVYGNADYNFRGMPGGATSDPRFVRPASAGADGTWGTADDDYGDLRLLAGSPCIDAGNNGYVPADSMDIDGDGNRSEPLPLDLAGETRLADDPTQADTGVGTPPIVDIGAYERCRPAGDVDGDWLTDVVDLLYLVEAWGTSRGQAGFDSRCDLNNDGAIDMADLLVMAGSFGA